MKKRIIDLNYTYDLIIAYHIATREELEIVISICGFCIKTLNDVIYYRTGYHDISQFLEYEGLNNDWQSIYDLFYMV